MRRLSLVLSALLFYGAPVHADSHGKVSSLAKVFEHPFTYDGRLFDGYVYVDTRSTYNFVPFNTEKENKRFGTITLLLGRKAEKLDMKPYHSGDRIRLRGRLEVDVSCFMHDTCVPFPRPIYLNDPQIVN